MSKKIDGGFAIVKTLKKLGIKDIKNDYLCIFENNGQEFPEIALGLTYKNAKSLAERKDACESKQRNADGADHFHRCQE